MRIVRNLPDMLEIRGNDAFRAPVLVGIIFLIVAAGFWITGQGPLTPTRWGSIGALVGTGLGLIWHAKGKSRRTWVRPVPPSVESKDGLVPATAGSILRLTAAPGPYPTGPARYGVELSTPAGARTLLFADDDPAVVLQGTALIASTLGLAVSPGWGLRSGAPWITQDGDSEVPPSSSATEEEEVPDTRKLALTIGVGSLAAAFIFILEIRGQIALGETPSMLSIVLPVLLVALLTGIALFVATDRETLAMTGDLKFERRIYGLVVHREVVPSKALRGAYLVGPRGLTRHLLVDTTDGPRAFPSDERRGREIVTTIEAVTRATTPAS